MVHVPTTQSKRRALARIVVYAPDEATMRWVKNELIDESATLETTDSLDQLLQSLADTVVAIVDFDWLDFDGTRRLRLARDEGWRGSLIALGRVDFDERRPLRIRASLQRPFGSERLRKAAGDLLAAEKRKRRATLMKRAASWRSEFSHARQV